MGINLKDAITEVKHPHDPLYRMKRQEAIDQLLPMSERQLGRMLQNMVLMPAIRDESKMSTKVLGEILDIPDLPINLRKGILDSTSGTTGNVLIRQDLEPVLYALFVKKFPAWERFMKAPSNGLVHAATQITTPDSGNTAGSSFVSELGTVSYSTGTYQRATFPIAVMANGRGVSLKEIAAVAQGGAAYNPQETESQNAMTKLASDAQWAMMQGNATNNPGTASQEQGLYNSLVFDGFRGVIGSVGSFSGNGATQLDINKLNILESIQYVASSASNNGGDPSLVLLSMLAKQYLDIEQQNNVRYNQQLADLIPGVKCNQINFANGALDIAPIPGSSVGTYNRTSDSVNVEDIYVIDESSVKIRWLYSPDWTVLQIPTGVDGQLSDRVNLN